MKRLHFPFSGYRCWVNLHFSIYRKMRGLHEDSSKQKQALTLVEWHLLWLYINHSNQQGETQGVLRSLWMCSAFTLSLSEVLLHVFSHMNQNFISCMFTSTSCFHLSWTASYLKDYQVHICVTWCVSSL